ncbi:hypothetical protein PHYSODRAFT_437219, partial [Phytophthora sojae]
LKMRFLLARVADMWEATQVELCGVYSVERVREVIQYSERISMFRALAVMALMPWPCVIITLLADAISLPPPVQETNGSYQFAIRTLFIYWISTVRRRALQFRRTVPSVGLSNARVMANAVLTAVLSFGALYVVTVAVGFPVPFTFITTSPAWVTFMLVPLASFIRKARSDPEVWLQIVNTLKTWVVQECLVLIYPTYFYIFTTLPANAKSPFTVLLPIIKKFMRNIMACTVIHLNDKIPEVVLMNVEVFNALFMSYCLQNSPSISTTLGLLEIDGAQMLVS